MISIRQAESASDCDHARRLIASFITWLEELYPDDPEGVDAYFASIQPVLASLPGAYLLPAGRLLLAVCDGTVAGMVAMRDLSNGACEMKRMFVDSGFQGTGIGRAMAEALISEARDTGYVLMRLDTGHRQVAAIGLYRSLGFKEIPPYYDISEEQRADLIFMELPLTPLSATGGTDSSA